MLFWMYYMYKDTHYTILLSVLPSDLCKSKQSILKPYSDDQSSGQKAVSAQF